MVFGPSAGAQPARTPVGANADAHPPHRAGDLPWAFDPSRRPCSESWRCGREGGRAAEGPQQAARDRPRHPASVPGRFEGLRSNLEVARRCAVFLSFNFEHVRLQPRRVVRSRERRGKPEREGSRGRRGSGIPYPGLDLHAYVRRPGTTRSGTSRKGRTLDHGLGRSRGPNIGAFHVLPELTARKLRREPNLRREKEQGWHDARTCTDARANACSGTSPHTGARPHARADAHTGTEPRACADAYASACADTHARADAHARTDTHARTDAHACADTHACADADTHPVTRLLG
jgi:hypothetical protein